MHFKRKRSLKVDRATFCTEWKSALIHPSKDYLLGLANTTRRQRRRENGVKVASYTNLRMCLRHFDALFAFSLMSRCLCACIEGVRQSAIIIPPILDQQMFFVGWNPQTSYKTKEDQQRWEYTVYGCAYAIQFRVLYDVASSLLNFAGTDGVNWCLIIIPPILCQFERTDKL